MSRITYSVLFLLLSATAIAAPKPNIVYILCDDLGYGDVKCLNADGKIATPHMDRLAKEGMIFTDAHSSSAVCSPTRYGIMTGRYNWRSKLQRGVLGGLSPRLIESGRLTVASLLKENGYFTACVGKWHLGMDWAKRGSGEVEELNIEKPEQVGNVDFARPIMNGPNSVGFDYYYGISASLDMVPYTFIENNRVAALPELPSVKFPMMTGRENGFTRSGPGAKDFAAVNVLPSLAKKAVQLIKDRAFETMKNAPFFLYMPLNAPHTPINPTKEWLGKSGISPYADFVMETDWAIGEVLRALDESGLAENTLVIVTSDNGCSPSAKFDELKAKGHNPSYVFRGNKADIYDGGHHIPFIARWPANVKAGTRYEPYVCLTDLMATVANILDVKLPDTAGEDSVSILPALRGETKPVRQAIVHHSITGAFSIRQGPWKLELCPGSAGWSDPKPGKEVQDAPRIQLYDLSEDIGESNNVQAQHPDIVDRLTKLLQKYVVDGRSTPGASQKNTVDPDIMSGTNPANIKNAKNAKPD